MTLTRKQFLSGMASLVGAAAIASHPSGRAMAHGRARHARAITMWDFSWLERRWSGGGYEDWDKILDELVVRGYDAVRIEAYPHLIDAGPEKLWRLKPVWHVQDWGAPGLVDVRVLPNLIEFIGKCHDRGIKLGLSSWYREDVDDIRMKIDGPDAMARIWQKTLDHVRDAGLLDAVLYVDLCNEWPAPVWAPFLNPPLDWGEWFAPRSIDWMKSVITQLHESYPDMPFLFSTNNGDAAVYAEHDITFADAIEHHQWMVGSNSDEFYRTIGYEYERFSEKDYLKVQESAADLYRQKPDYWNGLLSADIAKLADVSRRTGMPLMTTECWAIVDYKDWPLLPWDWVKDVCALGTLESSKTGRWLANATSNFCGPQFAGMWRDIGWHQRLTKVIRNAPIAPDLQQGRLYDRL